MRLILVIIGFLGAIALPFWVPLLCAVALSVRWRAWEVLVLGLFMDLLWMPGGFLPLCTTVAFIIVWALEPLRREFLFA